MALPSTLYHFEIALSDTDRSVYESLTLRVARHPSEAVDFLLARVLAYCAEFGPGIGFSAGLSTPDDPALHVRDDTGALTTWIDIGVPDAARLHKAAKLARRVAVYCHKPAEQLRRALAGQRIHRAEFLDLVEVDRTLLESWAQRLERRSKISLALNDGHIYLGLGEETLVGQFQRIDLAA